jgi:hypothetical protein
MGGGFYAEGRRSVKKAAGPTPLLVPSFCLNASLRHYAVTFGDLVVHEPTELLGGRAGRNGP